MRQPFWPFPLRAGKPILLNSVHGNFSAHSTIVFCTLRPKVGLTVPNLLLVHHLYTTSNTSTIVPRARGQIYQYLVCYCTILTRLEAFARRCIEKPALTGVRACRCSDFAELLGYTERFTVKYLQYLNCKVQHFPQSSNSLKTAPLQWNGGYKYHLKASRTTQTISKSLL